VSSSRRRRRGRGSRARSGRCPVAPQAGIGHGGRTQPRERRAAARAGRPDRPGADAAAAAVPRTPSASPTERRPSSRRPLPAPLPDPRSTRAVPTCRSPARRGARVRLRRNGHREGWTRSLRVQARGPTEAALARRRSPISCFVLTAASFPGQDDHVSEPTDARAATLANPWTRPGWPHRRDGRPALVACPSTLS
jgi:hypothetical protein